MRALEILATLGVVASILIFISSRSEAPGYVACAGFALLVIGFHAVVEGTRWQMIPIYLVGVLFSVYAAVAYVRGDRSVMPSGAEYLLGLGAVLFVGVGVLLSTALPVFRLPVPTGPYKIGTQIRHIIDMNRREPFKSGELKPRELMIQIWYPVDLSAEGELSTYRGRNETTYWNARYSLTKTHAIIDAAISVRQERYPVVVFAPSWWGGRNEATFQAEELASHGYVVVGMDHPYSTRLTVFADGRLARTKLVTGEDYSSDAAFQAFIAAADEQVKVRAEDARSVLDILERINAGDPERLLTARLDLNHVGILGYSIGGGVAAQACWLDRRFKAGVDLDGMLAADSEKQGTIAPFLFIFGESPPSREKATPADAAAKREAEFEHRQFEQVTRSLTKFGGFLLILPGQGHASFSDGPFYSPLNSMSYSNAADPERVARIVSKYVLAFFNHQLDNAADPVLFHPPKEIPNSTLKTY